ncbi:hypothetical protein IIA16_07025, partial [bacterium]|nr:hypothetical protein [bacterium]
PPTGEPVFTVSNPDLSEEGDNPTWCAHLEAPRTVWYEHFIHNRVMPWDGDMTQDLSAVSWIDEPAVPLRTGDPAHPTHPGTTQPWNIFSFTVGRPWGRIWPLIHEWPREGKTVRQSRIYAPEAVKSAWPPEIHIPRNVGHTTGEEVHPVFAGDGAGQTPVVIRGDERVLYTPGGDWRGLDPYVETPPANPQDDLFVLVRGRDNPGILAYTMPDSIFFQRASHAPLTYARGDRAFLGQEVAGPGSPRVMDILLEGGLTKLRDEYPSLYEEAKTKVCDWGRVEATYMVDIPPPGSDNVGFQGKWQGDPGGDPDWSKVYEEAVWFIPIRPQCCEEGSETVWVKLQDKQGLWRIASPDAAGLAVIAAADQEAVDAEMAKITVTMVRPEASHQQHSVNLHPLAGHAEYDDAAPFEAGYPDKTAPAPLKGVCPDSTATGSRDDELDEPQTRTGRYLCLEAKIVIQPNQVPGVRWTFTFEWADPSYAAPAGYNANVTNPGVECDFGKKDNLDPNLPVGQEDPPGATYWPCDQFGPGLWGQDGAGFCTERIPDKSDPEPQKWPWGLPVVPCDNRGQLKAVGDPAASSETDPWSLVVVTMEQLADPIQTHIKYEACEKHGMFLDAGEFTDYKYETLLDVFRDFAAAIKDRVG